jgi:glycosyltransferase involved in cell wall biosynthesis
MKKRTGKLVWTIHHLESYNDPQLDAFFDEQLKVPDGYATVSAYWQMLLKNKHGIYGRVIHNGVDMVKFHPKGDTTIWKERLNFFDEQKKMLLYVGGMEPRKGLEYMLLTFEIVLRRVPETYLVVVGKSAVSSQPKEKDLIEIMLDRTKTRNNVVFLDYVEDDDMPSLYSLAKMVILTSRNEGWGLSLQEAMASGKPIGAFSVGGIPELVTSEFGILVPMGDAGSLASGIVNVLKSPKRAKSMGKMARRRVEGFSWERSAREAEYVYEQLFRPPRRRAGPEGEDAQ